MHVSWFSIIINIQREKILYMLMTTLNRDQRVQQPLERYFVVVKFRRSLDDHEQQDATQRVGSH